MDFVWYTTYFSTCFSGGKSDFVRCNKRVSGCGANLIFNVRQWMNEWLSGGRLELSTQSHCWEVAPQIYRVSFQMQQLEFRNRTAHWPFFLFARNESLCFSQFSHNFCCLSFTRLFMWIDPKYLGIFREHWWTKYFSGKGGLEIKSKFLLLEW